MIRASGSEYYNPDEAAKPLIAANPGLEQVKANAAAWRQGKRLLERAITERLDFAFETTLGGGTMTRHPGRRGGRRVSRCASSTSGWPARNSTSNGFPNASAAGGHDIPEADIRRRWRHSRINLVRLLPVLTELRVYDNSAAADPAAGEAPRPRARPARRSRRTRRPARSHRDAHAGRDRSSPPPSSRADRRPSEPTLERRSKPRPLGGIRRPRHVAIGSHEQAGDRANPACWRSRTSTRSAQPSPTAANVPPDAVDEHGPGVVQEFGHAAAVVEHQFRHQQAGPRMRVTDLVADVGSRQQIRHVVAHFAAGQAARRKAFAMP